MNTNCLTRLAPVVLGLDIGCGNSAEQTPAAPPPAPVTYSPPPAPPSFAVTRVSVRHVRENQYHAEISAWLATRVGGRTVPSAQVTSFFSGQTMQNIGTMGVTAVHPSSPPNIRFQADPHPLSPYFVMNIRTGDPVVNGATTVIPYTCDAAQPSRSSTGSRPIRFERCQGRVTIQERSRSYSITDTVDVTLDPRSVPDYVNAVNDVAPRFVTDTLEQGLRRSMEGALRALISPRRVER